MAENLYQKRPGGFWIFRVEIDGQTHKRSTKQKDLKAAKRRAAEIETELRSGAAGWTKAKAMTLGEWKPIYRASYGARKKCPERDDQMFKHTESTLDNKRMDQITPVDAEAYLACAPGGTADTHVSARCRASRDG